MFFTIVLVVGILGQLSNGIPLESPSSDFSQFFDQRIVGGTEAPHGSSPHMVSLIVGFSWQSFVCGGSIIRKRIVLSAAHCIMVNWDGTLLETFHGMVGSNAWDKGTVVEFKTFKIHSEYNSATVKNDIGVLITNKDIQLSKTVAVIGLNFDFVGGDVECVVFGWGTQRLWGSIPNYIQTLAVSTISGQECVEGVKEVATNWGMGAPPVDPKVEICTFHSPGHGMCHGDSGSALICTDGLQVGIVSWGIPCAVGGPDVFVRVAAFKKFLAEFLWH